MVNFFTLIYMSAWFISTCPTRHKFHQSRNHLRLYSLLPSQHLAQCLGENKPSLRSYWTSQVALMVKNLLVNVGDIRDASSIPGSGRSLGGEHGNPLQYSCLGNSMERGAWWAAVHTVAESWAWLKRLGTHTHRDLTAFSSQRMNLQWVDFSNHGKTWWRYFTGKPLWFSRH